MSKVVANQAVGTELSEAIRRCRMGFIGIGLFGALINLLMLTAPLFMLQVYDRVLPSHSVQTLVGLGILTVVLFSFQGLLDIIRARVLLRIGGSISEDLSARVYDALIRLPLKTGVGPGGLQPMRDLDQIRSFLSSAGPAAIFDLPADPLLRGNLLPLSSSHRACGARRRPNLDRTHPHRGICHSQVGHIRR